MELVEAIKSRKSIRGYKSTPVSSEILTQILEMATRAPSALNTQPWKFTVLGGKLLDELRGALQKRFVEGAQLAGGFEPHRWSKEDIALQKRSLEGAETQPNFALPPPSGVYRNRQVDVAKSLFQLMGIAREDKAKRTEWTMRAFRFFDAPNAIIFSIDEEMSSFASMFGLGAIGQTIALLAVDFGLGTCIEQASITYPEVIRKITSIPESQKIVAGMAIGYPDWDFPANKLESNREPLSNIATWVGI
jgi:nitroreductase